jgi:formate C-acetyltransferase
MYNGWVGFKEGKWQEEVNVQNFIQNNYIPYDGDDSFLKGISEKTLRVWNKCEKLLKEEIKHGVIGIDVDRFAGIDNYEPGYIDQRNEVIFGLQTDEPLKRIVNPYGGMRLVRSSLKAYGYSLNKTIDKHFSEYRKTHNQGVFDVYTKEMLAARSSGLLTGLPDAYGRGRIIGDYRRVALYGIDYLIEKKKEDHDNLQGDMLDDLIRKREDTSEHIKVLKKMKKMALSYGIDISLPASNAKEAFQWLYFGYLAAVKENNGAAMSLGRTATFLDIYIERDIKAGILSEKEAQELVDQFIIKLRLVRHLRTPEYDELFAGDPTWVTESIGGMGLDGRSLVTKNSYRYLHSLINLGSAPEPNMTILWSKDLPSNFKKYCAKMSIMTDALQYENDDIMRPIYGDDYAIACCVSAMTLGKQMQYFGARANIAKALLYSINGGYDEITGKKVIDNIDPITDEYLDYDKVVKNYNKVLKYLANLYVNTMNIIHYMHDKYAYERGQMALHDTEVERLMAFGVAGLSVAVDSLSAIKYAKVRPIRNDQGITTDFIIEGDFPKFGNDNNDVDIIATELVEKFSNLLKEHKLYRNAIHTLSILTITSNVVYGLITGATPDGRKAGDPYAPGANPMHGRDINGALASLNSVAKLKYCNVCQDGISNTFSIIPDSLGKDDEVRTNNLVALLDGYFIQNAHHLNVNVLSKEILIEAQKNPEKYPMLTIRVSGYAVHFNNLTKKQQDEVISRTFHNKL